MTSSQSNNFPRFKLFFLMAPLSCSSRGIQAVGRRCQPKQGYLPGGWLRPSGSPDQLYKLKTLVGWLVSPRCRDRPSRALPLTSPNVKNLSKNIKMKRNASNKKTGTNQKTSKNNQNMKNQKTKKKNRKENPKNNEKKKKNQRMKKEKKASRRYPPKRLNFF